MQMSDLKKCAEYVHGQRGKVFSGNIAESRITEIERVLELVFNQGYSLGRKEGYEECLSLDLAIEQDKDYADKSKDS
jgi:hypothetical protein